VESSKVLCCATHMKRAYLSSVWGKETRFACQLGWCSIGRADRSGAEDL